MIVPEISVIIPAYNSEQFISETLTLVLAQTFQSFEIIVVNDGSTDRTKEIVSEFINKDQRIKLINQSNLGTATARNRGIKESSAGLIAFLDSDDLWHPDKLNKQIGFMKKFPKIAIVSCLAEIVDENSICQGLLAGRNLNGSCYREILDTGGISGGSIVIVRKKCFEQIGYFDSALEPFEDWDMWIRLARCFELATIPEILVGYRRSPKCASRNYSRLKKSGTMVLQKTFREDKVLSTNNYYKHCLARNIAGIGAWCLIDGNYKESWECVKESLNVNFLAVLKNIPRFSSLLLLILATILPKKIFRKLFMETLLPRIFGLKKGKYFQELQSI